MPDALITLFTERVLCYSLQSQAFATKLFMHVISLGDQRPSNSGHSNRILARVFLP